VRLSHRAEMREARNDEALGIKEARTVSQTGGSGSCTSRTATDERRSDSTESAAKAN